MSGSSRITNRHLERSGRRLRAPVDAGPGPEEPGIARAPVRAGGARPRTGLAGGAHRGHRLRPRPERRVARHAERLRPALRTGCAGPGGRGVARPAAGPGLKARNGRPEARLGQYPAARTVPAVGKSDYPGSRFQTVQHPCPASAPEPLFKLPATRICPAH